MRDLQNLVRFEFLMAVFLEHTQLTKNNNKHLNKKGMKVSVHIYENLPRRGECADNILEQCPPFGRPPPPCTTPTSSQFLSPEDLPESVHFYNVRYKIQSFFPS